ncbi:unnamed protein product, partial [Meganyctiphanes norvegica]
RYSLVHEWGDRWKRWQLVIRDVRVGDVGVYRCQVATMPPLMLDFSLQVIEPRVRIVDDRGTDVLEKHYNSGSMIELKCLLDHLPFPHLPVTWTRDKHLLVFNTSRGGISVKSSPDTGLVTSRLYVASASPFDSGVYSCCYGNYSRDTVAVHVIAGEICARNSRDTVAVHVMAAAAAAAAVHIIAVHIISVHVIAAVNVIVEHIYIP